MFSFIQWEPTCEKPALGTTTFVSCARPNRVNNIEYLKQFANAPAMMEPL